MQRPDSEVVYRPLLILAYADSAHAAGAGADFRRLGWEVQLVATAAEARRLAATRSPDAIVLDTELPDESGWLACAKINQDDPALKVVLLAPERSAAIMFNFTQVDAVALVTRTEPLAMLAESVVGRSFAQAI